LDELPKPVADRDAVAVDEGDDLAAGLLDPAVSCVGDAPALLAQVADREAVNDLGCPVGRGVVDDEGLVAVGRVVLGD